jgi:hypothetical protein
MIRCPSIWNLAISHYTPLPGELFSSTNFMLPIITLPKLGTLHINDVSLHSSPSTLTASLPLTDGIRFSHIRDFEPIADMLGLLPEDLDISLTRCAIGQPKGAFNWDGRLTLCDIEADEDLVPLLCCWEGGDLSVDNCPGFNDAVLDLMATVVAGKYVCAPRVGDLDITDCPNFSAAALMRLVSARLEVSNGRIYPGFIGVCISGLAPDISTEDQEQISQHVYQFNYCPSSS